MHSSEFHKPNLQVIYSRFKLKKKISQYLEKNIRHWNHKTMERGRVKLRKMGKVKISKYLLNEI